MRLEWSEPKRLTQWDSMQCTPDGSVRIEKQSKGNGFPMVLIFIDNVCVNRGNPLTSMGEAREAAQTLEDRGTIVRRVPAALPKPKPEPPARYAPTIGDALAAKIENGDTMGKKKTRKKAPKKAKPTTGGTVGRRYTEAEKAKLLAKLGDSSPGSVEAKAIKLGVSYSTARKWMQEAGMKVDHRKTPKDSEGNQVGQLARLKDISRIWNDKRSVKAACAERGITPSAYYGWILRMGGREKVRKLLAQYNTTGKPRKGAAIPWTADRQPRRTTAYSDDFKLQVLEDMATMGRTRAAQKHDLNPAMVGRWSRDAGGVERAETPPAPAPKTQAMTDNMKARAKRRRKGVRLPFDKDEKHNIGLRLLAGKTPEDISGLFGTHVSTIFNVRQAIGHKVFKTARGADGYWYSPGLQKKVIRMVMKEGVLRRDAAQEMDVPLSTLSRWLKRAGHDRDAVSRARDTFLAKQGRLRAEELWEDEEPDEEPDEELPVDEPEPDTPIDGMPHAFAEVPRTVLGVSAPVANGHTVPLAQYNELKVEMERQRELAAGLQAEATALRVQNDKLRASLKGLIGA